MEFANRKKKSNHRIPDMRLDVVPRNVNKVKSEGDDRAIGSSNIQTTVTRKYIGAVKARESMGAGKVEEFDGA